MPKGRIPRQYQYKSSDDPAQVAEQFGTTPQALIDANQGGYPFNTGQMINLPTPYNYAPQIAGKGRAPQRDTFKENVGIFAQNVGAFFAPGYGPRQYQPYVSAPQPMRPQPQPVQQPTAAQAFRTRDEISMPTVEVFQNGLQRLAEGADISTFSAPEQAALIGLMVDNGLLPPGTTARDLTNPQGQVTTGAAPFGVNQQGQRVDIYGNAWDPTTAQRDIYGGAFRQPGETRWRRNAAGNLIKEVLVSGNKWVRVRSGGGGGGSSVQQQQEQPTLTSFGVVNFGAGAG